MTTTSTLKIDQRLLDQLAARLATKHADSFSGGRAKGPRSGNGVLAVELAVSWQRLKMWRNYRGVPPAYRFRVAMLAKRLGIKVADNWIDTTTIGEDHGRTGNGRKAPQGSKAQAGKRRRTQQRRNRGAAADRRYSGRGAPAAP